jgi:PAS domain S-box-containing protein
MDSSLQVLWEDGERVFCRRWRDGVDGDRNAVLAVHLAAEHPTPGSLNRLAHEYGLKHDLDDAWAVPPLELARERGRTILVLKDPGGEPLHRLLGPPMEVERFLRLAVAQSAALGRLHQRSLIHKDIKPSNFIVNSATGQVWLTGFGIASRLPRERQSAEPPEFIAGTLAYMAPEQTGRVNRSIDSRSDLYSLGVTLYEMLTGGLPFMASDPMEWIHCHIARKPVPPGERRTDVPAPISAMILKLLAKTAEERYQTASGLEADLRHCLAEWQSQGRIDSFPLGAHDASDRLLIPEKLYGREREIDTLLAAFDRVVAQGTSELVLVSGYSGVGKSSVVNELHKMLVLPRGLFATGKFDQYKRDIPYTTLAQAFQTLMRQILIKSEAEVAQWRHSLQEALGPNGQLVVNLIPELEFLIGTQPPVPELPPREAQNRFQWVFRRFLGAFARPEHPLALFLDDLQWLDAATLELLEHLMTDPDVRHLMLVGAYRDNEVSLSHPLMRTLEVIRNAGARVQEIVLAPLGLADVGALVSDALHCAPAHARPLAQLVHEKTVGNPFFAIQFLTALAEEGLLTFDPDAAAWMWDVARIHAKGYTDNVVDLMAAKLKRASATTQEALKQLACLGNVAPTATLALVLQETAEAIDAALLEAVYAGLVFQHQNAYKFLHDRIQQVAYSLIPEGRRADFHLHIGRVLLASMTADGLAEHLFDVANQLNRGAARLIDRDEKAQVATIDLSAGRKAKTSAAYASAREYFLAGMALLDESDWGGLYALTFSLWLERAECEFLTGDFGTAEQLIGELLQRGASKVDQAAIYHLKVRLHEAKGEYSQAVASALACLRLFDIDLPAHPTWEQVQAEYETVWQTLNERPIESLIEMPLMTDPELQAAMQVLSITPTYATDLRLYCLNVCRMVNVALQHGTSGACAHAFGYCGFILGPVFHRYRDAPRFAKLACDLVEKHGFIAYRAKVYQAMALVAFWTQPITSALDFMRVSVRTAIETGDLAFACYSMNQSVTGLLLRNDPLDAVWRESEMALDFVRKAGLRDMAAAIVSQQRFIATMQGRTATFSTFSNVQFDEATFEAHLTGDRMALMVCFYWILKLKARFLSGDYAEAVAAAGKVKPLLWAAAGQIQLLDYFYYGALTVAACYEKASADEQNSWHELLTAHQEQLREWADNYPPTFGDNHALVSAEIARLEGRYGDAMEQYEQAIKSAREHGFVQNEGVAHEVAARFYAARGVESIAHTYLCNARHCYLRWGALGKVRQLERLNPWLAEESAASVLSATINAPVEQLDVGTVVKASQAVSSEIELGKLIETLMIISVEHAGAERGVLILFRGDEPRIVAEATTGDANIEVKLRNSAVTPTELIESVLHTALRTRESVILDDASARIPFSADGYVRQKHARSVLCLPLIKQGKLVGALYLENNLTPRVFTQAKLAVLTLLASQSAISLEYVRLYDELQHENSERKRAEQELRRSDSYLSEAQRLSHTGSFGWRPSSGEIYWSEETFRIFEYDPTTTEPTVDLMMRQRIHPEDVATWQQVAEHAAHEGQDFAHEHRLRMPDGRVKHLHLVAHAIRTETGEVDFVGAVRDVTEEKWAQAERERLEQRLRQAAKMEAVGRFAGGIAHDFNNVLAGVLAYGEMAFDEAPADSPRKRYAQNVLNAASRGRELVEQILTYSRSQRGKREPVDVTHVVAEALELLRGSLPAGIRLETSAPASPLVAIGDATQLHQVVMNLCSNAIQAMRAGGILRVLLETEELSGKRALSHGTLGAGRYLRLIFADSGSGMDAATLARIFEAFFTTKEVGQGTGLGLSLVYAIIADSGGVIDVKSAPLQGTTVTIYLPRSEVPLATAESGPAVISP